MVSVLLSVKPLRRTRVEELEVGQGRSKDDSVECASADDADRRGIRSAADGSPVDRAGIQKDRSGRRGRALERSKVVPVLLTVPSIVTVPPLRMKVPMPAGSKRSAEVYGCVGCGDRFPSCSSYR